MFSPKGLRFVVPSRRFRLCPSKTTVQNQSLRTNVEIFIPKGGVCSVTIHPPLGCCDQKSSNLVLCACFLSFDTSEHGLDMTEYKQCSSTAIFFTSIAPLSYCITSIFHCYHCLLLSLMILIHENIKQILVALLVILSRPPFRMVQRMQIRRSSLLASSVHQIQLKMKLKIYEHEEQQIDEREYSKTKNDLASSQATSFVQALLNVHMQLVLTRNLPRPSWQNAPNRRAGCTGTLRYYNIQKKISLYVISKCTLYRCRKK